MTLKTTKTGSKKRASLESGAMMAEAALALAFYMFLLISVFEFGRLSYVVLAGNYSVSQTARWAAMGERDAGFSKVQSIVNRLEELGTTTGININPDNISLCPLDNVGECNVLENPSDSGEAFELIYRHIISISFFGDINLTFQSIITNEPF